MYYTFQSGSLDDTTIIEGCKSGNAKYQKALYDKYSRKMYAVCLRYARNPSDAEDILQDGFVKVFTKLEQFLGEGSFEGWIRRTMVNTALRHYKRLRYEAEKNGYEILPDYPINEDALANIGAEELLRMIDTLPSGYKTVFNMVAIDGFSHTEVGELLGIGDSTSRSQLTKARKMLCKMLEDKDAPQKSINLKLNFDGKQ